jgi:signal transduction histidine kinase
VAHDLKNPLGVITGYITFLNDSWSDLPAEQVQELLQTISQTGYKMSNIIEELLLLAGVRQKEVVPEPLENMADLVAGSKERLLTMIQDQQAEIVGPDKWPVALGYGPWIEEVWTNYISNAIKYGGDPPRVEVGATTHDNGKIQFWVRDNGPGLTPEEQERLFTPFTRLHQVRAKGHGLGLSIVHRIVEKLGGEVGVESEGVPGQGSIFSFTLPSVEGAV